MKPKHHTVIISSKPGQLGNMLILFSHFIALGIEKNVSIKAPAFEEYADYFKSTNGALIPSFPAKLSTVRNKWLRNLIYRISNLFARTLNRLKINNRLFSSIGIDWDESLTLHDDPFLNSRYIFVTGWLYRSDILIEKHKKEIIDFFKPLDAHLANIDKLLPVKDQILIGVHIRQGDYKVFEGGKYFFETQQYLSVMKKAMHLLEDEKIRFLICSNTNLKTEDFPDVPFLFGTGNEIEDLYAFTKCSYLIGPPSTFTMWASFYNDVPLYMIRNAKSAFTLEDFKIAKT